MVFSYSFRLIRREWKKYVLPFISLSFIATIVFVILLLTGSTKNYLLSKNQEIVGGDISFESSYKIDKAELLSKIPELNANDAYSEVQSFNAIISAQNGKAIPVSIESVDQNYPLYGSVLLRNNAPFLYQDTAIYLDKNSSERLGVSMGDWITFGNAQYQVSGIIDKEPSAILGGFRFLPKAIITQSAFAKSGIDPALLRSEYQSKFKILNTQKIDTTSIISAAKDMGARVQIASNASGGFIQGLSLLSQFLILSVLLVCVLAVVNIYTSVAYLLDMLKKSLAILLSIGLSKNRLILTLSLSFFYIVVGAALTGLLIGYITFLYVINILNMKFDLLIQSSNIVMVAIITFSTLLLITVSSFIPAVKGLLGMSPKDLIVGNDAASDNVSTIKTVFYTTILTILPLIVITLYLVQNTLWGVLIMLGIALTYIVLAALFYSLIRFMYKKRSLFSFQIKTIISQKYSDGVLGVVSLTSLFVALSVLSILMLLQRTVADFLNEDLKRTVPSVYVIDIQESQKEKLLNAYPAFTLFPNVAARIVSIDNRNIQEELLTAEGTERELGREYNVTFRDSLLTSEKIVSGEKSIGKKGFASIDADFAERAGIRIGSQMMLSIQGFNVPVTVNNLRETDSRSGLPFFYIVLSRDDIAQFPKTFFGYADYSEGDIRTITKYLADNMPNTSIINTSEISGLASELIQGLLVLVFAVSLPPLILAIFLIITLILSLFNARKRDASQIMALGGERIFVRNLYLKETVSGTFVIACVSYTVGVFVVYYISKYYLDVKRFTYYNIELVYALIAILLLVLGVAYTLWANDKKSIKELLLENK